MGYVIGIDVGTTGTKTILMDEQGNVAARALAEYPLLSPKPGWAEQDPEQWWQACVDTLCDVMTSSGVDARDVAGIGLTGQMHGAVFLDRNNNVVRPPILWCDQRTAEQCEFITAKIGAARLIELVCNPALTGFTAPKILWLKQNEPEKYSEVVKVLLPKDYIRFKLTGEFATEVSDASGTLLFDVTNRRWSTEVMSELDIPADFMPQCYESPEVSGKLSADVAGRVGLKPGTPVVGGGGDQAAGAVGNGIVRQGVISSTVGTSGVVFAFSDKVTLDPQGRVHTFCHAVPGAWHVMGVMLSAGGSLRWYRDTFALEEKALAASSGRDPYEHITEQAGTAPVGSEGLIFLPYLTGERTPHADPHARGVFFGLSLRHTKAHAARAILEGVAYGMRDSLEIIKGMGVPITEIRASGGGARSRLWRQIQADVNGVAMVTINVDEGPAYGAALLAAVGAGLFGSVEEACDATISVRDKVEPNAEAGRIYEKYYCVYRNLYTDLKPRFRDVSAIVAG
jgi:xylulokinase